MLHQQLSAASFYIATLFARVSEVYTHSNVILCRSQGFIDMIAVLTPKIYLVSRIISHSISQHSLDDLHMPVCICFAPLRIIVEPCRYRRIK